MGDTGPESPFVHWGASPQQGAARRAGEVVVTQGAPPQNPRGWSLRLSTGVCPLEVRPRAGARVYVLPLNSHC